MVVHGRDEKNRRALFSFLRSIGLHPLEWSQAIDAAGSSAPYVGEVLDAAFSTAQAVVVLLTPDEEVRLRPSLQSEPGDDRFGRQSRPNVGFEAGMALAYAPERTVLVEIGRDMRAFSDIAGRHTVRMDGSVKKRQDLAQRLERAGCPVDLSGRDWHDEGDFDFETDHGESLEHIVRDAQAASLIADRFRREAETATERLRTVQESLETVLEQNRELTRRLADTERDLAHARDQLGGITAAMHEAQDEAALLTYYDEHLHDILNGLQRVLSGTIAGVTTNVFIEQGVLLPAREFMTRGDDEHVRLSILVPHEDGYFRMEYAAGHDFAAKQDLRIPIEDSFAGAVLRNDELLYSGDVDLDERFLPHPPDGPGREYKSILGVPIRSGDQTVGVLSAISTFEDAFEPADQNYVLLIGAILNVLWSLRVPPAGDAEG